MKIEANRYTPFVRATNDALQKLESFKIEGLKNVPKDAGRIIFLVNHPNEIQIQSGTAASHRKPDVVIMRLGDAARAYSSSQPANEWEQLKMIAQNGVKPRNFHRILSCVEFKATRSDLEMEDCSTDVARSLNKVEPMHIIVDGPAFRAAKVAEQKKRTAGSQVSQVTRSGSENRKRAREPVEAGSELGSEPPSAKRVAVESGPTRSWYSRATKESQTGPAVPKPKQTTESQKQTLQEKTAEDKTRDPILQAGSYAVEMLSMSRVHVWNILIIGMCLGFGPGFLF
jgi:hypothetical protein